MKCRHCRYELPEGETVCFNCGEDNGPNIEQNNTEAFKKIKVIFIVITLVIIAVSAIFIMYTSGRVDFSNFFGTQQNVEVNVDEEIKKATEYINNKYDDEFEYVDIEVMDSSNYVWLNAYFTSKNLNNIKIKVSKFGDSYTDNYAEYYFKDDIQKIYTELSQEIYSSAKVLVKVSEYNLTDINPEDVKEYLKYGGISSDITIIIDDSINSNKTKVDDIKKFADLLINKGYSSDISIYYLSNVAYNSVNDFESLYNYNIIASGVFMIDKYTKEEDLLNWEK